MHIKKLFTIYVIIISIASNTTSIASASSSSPKPLTPNTGKCRLVVDDAHISTYDKERTGKDFVKVKVWSECYLTQTNATIILTIYKVDSVHGDKKIGIFNNYTDVKSGKLVEIKNAKILCVNKIPTKYYGVAKAHVIIPGLGTFDKTTQSLNKNQLPCGVLV